MTPEPLMAFDLSDPGYQAAVQSGELPPLGEDVDQTILVTGPPRSGTSMVAGLLHKAGVWMGSKLLTNTEPHAPAGLFENNLVIKLNEMFLAGASGSWLNPPPPENMRLLTVAPLVEGLVRYEQRPSWGMKDPSFCLTLGLWAEVLEYVRPRVVVCHRNPYAIAQSLMRFWTASIDHGLAVANIHELRLTGFLSYHRHWPVLHVSYEAFIADPLAEAGRLALFCGLTLSDDVVTEFVDGTHKHF